MKTILVATAALTLLGAPAAFAQQDQNGQNGHHGQGQGGQSGQGQGGQGHGAAAQGGQAPQRPANPTTQAVQGGGHPDWNAYYRNNPDLQKAYQQNKQSPIYTESQQAFAERHYLEHGKAEGRALPQQQGASQPSNSQQGGQGQGGQWRDGRWQGNGDGRQNGQSGGQRNGQWSGGNDRYRAEGDRSRGAGYQRNIFAQRRFRAGQYERPRGYYYRRWSFGEILPYIFFSRDYWLNDFNDYDLSPPPPGCEWVRYGDDALLVDIRSGEILETVYGVFY